MIELLGQKPDTQIKHCINIEYQSTGRRCTAVSRQFQVGRRADAQVMRKQFQVRHSAAETVYGCELRRHTGCSCRYELW